MLLVGQSDPNSSEKTACESRRSYLSLFFNKAMIPTMRRQKLKKSDHTIMFTPPPFVKGDQTAKQRIPSYTHILPRYHLIGKGQIVVSFVNTVIIVHNTTLISSLQKNYKDNMGIIMVIVIERGYINVRI